MKRKDSEFWAKASQAQKELESQLADHPDVCRVDIGYPPGDDGASKEVTLRIHACKDEGNFPTEVDGIPVTVSPSRRRR